MRMIDIIEKKKHGFELNEQELKYFTNSVKNSDIPDYQISAFLMAIYFKGMSLKETAVLTQYMTESGDVADLSSIEGYKVDKHSTGGVGDKTSLVVVPIVASLGVKVAKMSGRGLGHTGGTIDKLESIPGFKTNLSTDKFFEIVNSVGAAIVGQTGNFAPVDKKLYALRDVTATVDSIPLIAASIMSKKLASGADGIVLDVKTGSGAFAKNFDDAVKLAKVMVSIGKHAKKDITAVITNMDRPLGYAIGNNLEVIEAVNTLKGEGPKDFEELCVEIASDMVSMAKNIPFCESEKQVRKSIKDKSALKTFCKMVDAQEGDSNYISDTDLFPKAIYIKKIIADKDYFISSIDTYKIGVAACILGAGRKTKDSQIDFSAGIMLYLKTGDKVKKGDILAELFTNDSSSILEAENEFKSAFTFSDTMVKSEKIVMARITDSKEEIL